MRGLHSALPLSAQLHPGFVFSEVIPEAKRNEIISGPPPQVSAMTVAGTSHSSLQVLRAEEVGSPRSLQLPLQNTVLVKCSPHGVPKALYFKRNSITIPHSDSSVDCDVTAQLRQPASGFSLVESKVLLSGQRQPSPSRNSRCNGCFRGLLPGRVSASIQPGTGNHLGCFHRGSPTPTPEWLPGPWRVNAGSSLHSGLGGWWR